MASRRTTVMSVLLVAGSLCAGTASASAGVARGNTETVPRLAAGAAIEAKDISAVQTISPDDGWAVGSYCASSCTTSPVEQGLILHWNGELWSKVASPNPSAASDYLSAVAADSTSDAWAVGTTDNSNGQADTLALQWNGKSWLQVVSPSPGKYGSVLDGVAAVSGTDAWAVGYDLTSTSQDTLVLRWNGRTWSKVTSPSPGASVNYLYAVSAASADDAWAAGIYLNKAGDNQTMLMHWNGTAWSKVSSPDPGKSGSVISAVTAVSATDAWAVGNYCTTSGCVGDPPDKTLILHWNGKLWSKVASPNPGYANTLDAVSAYSTTGAWAVGSYDTKPGGNPEILLLRWNGKAWSRVTSPAERNNYLIAISAASAKDAWAAGSVLLRWNGAWSVVG